MSSQSVLLAFLTESLNAGGYCLHGNSLFFSSSETKPWLGVKTSFARLSSAFSELSRSTELFVVVSIVNGMISFGV